MGVFGICGYSGLTLCGLVHVGFLYFVCHDKLRPGHDKLASECSRSLGELKLTLLSKSLCASCLMNDRVK